MSHLHAIEFRGEYLLILEMLSKTDPAVTTKREVKFTKGSQWYASLRPSVVKDREGNWTEIAELHFDDGAVARGVRFECFRFVE
jgi:hypothetical protein